jgi:hypothetical protein
MVEGHKTTLGRDKKPGEEGAESDEDDEFPTIRF